MSNMARFERIVARLPEAERVDVEEWGDHPTLWLPAVWPGWSRPRTPPAEERRPRG